MGPVADSMASSEVQNFWMRRLFSVGMQIVLHVVALVQRMVVVSTRSAHGQLTVSMWSGRGQDAVSMCRSCFARRGAGAARGQGTDGQGTHG